MRSATSAPNGPISSAAKGKGAGLHALVRLTPDLIEISAAVDPGAHGAESIRPVGIDAQAGDPDNITVGAAATIARVEPGGECLAIHARQLVVEPDLRVKPTKGCEPSLGLSQPWTMI